MKLFIHKTCRLKNSVLTTVLHVMDFLFLFFAFCLIVGWGGWGVKLHFFSFLNFSPPPPPPFHRIKYIGDSKYFTYRTAKVSNHLANQSFDFVEISTFLLLIGSIQLLRSHLVGEGVHQSANACKQGEDGGVISLRMFAHSFFN